MSIRKIVLLEPMPGHQEKDFVVRDSSCVTSGSPIVLREPIAIQYIGGYLKSKGYEVTLLQQKDMTITQIVNTVIELQPDVFGISVHASYIFASVLEMSKSIKKLCPEIYIVCGGNHPTGFPHILEQDCIDFVVLGEGEETFYQLLRSLERDQDPSGVPGLAWRDKENRIVINPLAKRLEFAELPWPMRDKQILDYCKCAPLSYPIPTNQKSAAQVSYSRGCSGGCEFCVSNYLWGKKLSYREPDDVINELKSLNNEYGTNFFFLTDLTFNGNKQKAIDFCKALIKSRINMSWFAYCDVHLQPDIAKYMKEAGCSRIGFGLEAVVDQGLEKIKPHQNLDKIASTLEMTSDLGILNRCYLMIGFPWETEAYLEKTKLILKELCIDQLRVGFVVPFPGTKLFDDWSDIRSRNFNEYSGDLPVVDCKHISKERLLQIRDQMVTEFYNSWSYWNRCNMKIKKHPYLGESYKYFFNYLMENGVIQPAELVVQV